jgi:hypothetical protein
LPDVEYVVDDLEGRILAALAGAVAGERRAGITAGAAQLLSAAESLASTGGYDADDLAARGLDQLPPPGLAGLTLRAVAYGLATPADRPLLRRSAHRSARLAGADEGTAMTAVATAVLTADLLRFDLGWCLARLHQTLLEEAPLALLHRLQPLDDSEPLRGDTDPGAALQIAITALHRAGTVPDVLDELSAYGEELSVATALAGALAGARSGRQGDMSWLADTPDRVQLTAEQLAARTRSLLPPAQGDSRSGRATTIESPGHERS